MSSQPLSLADSFRRLIRNDGPLSLIQYMGDSNARYYAGKDPLGLGKDGSGDFVTAPEISQMFGELIGLWLADMWIDAGRKGPVYYAELGPGRGTLAGDALRAARRYGLDPHVHLVEPSPALKDVQRQTLPDAIWHDDLAALPSDGPLLLIANEFLDALPIRQFVRGADGWRERMIGLKDDGFVFVAGTTPIDAAVPAQWHDAAQGTILETCPGAAAVMHEVAARLAHQGGAALFIDYGHTETTPGSTIQAVCAHKQVDPFDAPGKADLTALVDFAALSEVAQSSGARYLGTVTQGDWLQSMGIEARAQKLSESSPHHAREVAAALERLTAADQMGDLFKVMGLAGSNWAGGAGFPLS